MSSNERNVVNGILLLDKPRGFTSNQCLQQVKRILCAKKAGHTGTLDPLATGLLPIALGEATKFIQHAHQETKIYRATGVLGQQRDTGDELGEVIAEAVVPDLTDETLLPVLQRFTGAIEQVPPMYSALKHQGQRLYDLARKGVEVARAPRQITIHRLELLKLTPTSFEIEVCCSQGTYIRTLIEDIAEALGTKAYMSALTRTSCAGFHLDAAISLQALKDLPEDRIAAQLLSADRFLSPQLPSMHLSSAELKTLYFGKPLRQKEAKESLVKLFSDQYGFCGLGQLNLAGELRSKRLVGRPDSL